MLTKFNEMKTLAFEIDQFDDSAECYYFHANQYLQAQELEGPQGHYHSFDEYTKTVNMLNALKAQNVETFKKWYNQLSLNLDSKIAIFQDGKPYNPYVNLAKQPKKKLESIALEVIAYCYLKESSETFFENCELKKRTKNKPSS